LGENCKDPRIGVYAPGAYGEEEDSSVYSDHYNFRIAGDGGGSGKIGFGKQSKQSQFGSLFGGHTFALQG
jgi:hypothetical protein